jgi:hypothetical protein
MLIALISIKSVTKGKVLRMIKKHCVYTLIFVFVGLMLWGAPLPLAYDTLLGNIDGTEINPPITSVPKPMLIVLLIIGVIGLTGIARKYRSG